MLPKKTWCWLVCIANLARFSIKAEAMLKFILAIECETTFHCSLQEELKYNENEHITFI